MTKTPKSLKASKMAATLQQAGDNLSRKQSDSKQLQGLETPGKLKAKKPRNADSKSKE